MIDSRSVGSTNFHSSHPQGHAPELANLSGRGAATEESAHGTPTQSHISPRILVYEDKEKGNKHKRKKGKNKKQKQKRRC